MLNDKRQSMLICDRFSKYFIRACIRFVFFFFFWSFPLLLFYRVIAIMKWI